MVITGTINSVSTKVLQKTKSLGALFESHQWIISFCMFIGECASLIGYAVVTWQEKDLQKKIDHGEVEPLKEEDLDENEIKERSKPKANNFVFAISASCDLTATTIGTFGLTYLSTSMYQMFRGMELMWIMVFSFFFLKNDIYRQHYLGVGIVITGLFFVGLNSVTKGGEAITNPFAGISLLCISQIFSATQYCVQETILKKYRAHAFQLVGFEGLWGMTIYSILLIIFQFWRCDNWGRTIRKGVCIANEIGEWRVEDTLFAFRQLGESATLTILLIAYIISIALYNIVGINLTKLVSSAARAVVDTVRTVFVWLWFLIGYAPEGSRETFGYLQLIGFILLILGMLIYNEILELKFWNLNYYCRTQIYKRGLNPGLLVPGSDTENQVSVDKESEDVANKE